MKQIKLMNFCILVMITVTVGLLSCNNPVESSSSYRAEDNATVQILLPTNHRSAIAEDFAAQTTRYRLTVLANGGEEVHNQNYLADTAVISLILTPGSYTFSLYAYDEEILLGSGSKDATIQVGQNDIQIVLFPNVNIDVEVIWHEIISMIPFEGHDIKVYQTAFRNGFSRDHFYQYQNMRAEWVFCEIVIDAPVPLVDANYGEKRYPISDIIRSFYLSAGQAIKLRIHYTNGTASFNFIQWTNTDQENTIGGTAGLIGGTGVDESYVFDPSSYDFTVHETGLSNGHGDDFYEYLEIREEWDFDEILIDADMPLVQDRFGQLIYPSDDIARSFNLETGQAIRLKIVYNNATRGFDLLKGNYGLGGSWY